MSDNIEDFEEWRAKKIQSELSQKTLDEIQCRYVEEFGSFLKDHMADSLAIALDGLMHNAHNWTSHDLMIEQVRACMIKRYGSADPLEEFLNLCVHYACSDRTHLTLTEKE